MSHDDYEFDLFLSHASEDKEAVVRPLASMLAERGIRIWLDETALTLGDSLRRSIDRGLARSRFGLVVLSRSFFDKEWPQRELDALAARVDREKTVLPIWHGVGRSEVEGYSPMLADKLAVSTAAGLDKVVAEVLRALGHDDRAATDEAPDQKDEISSSVAWLPERAQWQGLEFMAIPGRGQIRGVSSNRGGIWYPVGGHFERARYENLRQWYVGGLLEEARFKFELRLLLEEVRDCSALLLLTISPIAAIPLTSAGFFEVVQGSWQSTTSLDLTWDAIVQREPHLASLTGSRRRVGIGVANVGVVTRKGSPLTRRGSTLTVTAELRSDMYEPVLAQWEFPSVWTEEEGVA